jgi:hypothetical protein
MSGSPCAEFGNGGAIPAPVSAGLFWCLVFDVCPTVRSEGDCARVAFVSGAEPQLVIFCEIVEASVHPLDADPRLIKILLTTRSTEVRCDASKLSRDILFGLLRQPLRLFIECPRDGKTLVPVAGSQICADRSLFGGRDDKGRVLRGLRRDRRNRKHARAPRAARRWSVFGRRVHCGKFVTSKRLRQL